MKYSSPISLNSRWCTAPGTDLFLKLSHFVGRRHNLIDFNQCISVSLDAFFKSIFPLWYTNNMLTWLDQRCIQKPWDSTCFISILKPTQPVYAFDTPGAASEGEQCTTAGCVQRNVTKHRALNWGWNNFFWAGGGKQSKRKETGNYISRVLDFTPLKLPVESLSQLIKFW